MNSQYCKRSEMLFAKTVLLGLWKMYHCIQVNMHFKNSCSVLKSFTYVKIPKRILKNYKSKKRKDKTSLQNTTYI